MGRERQRGGSGRLLEEDPPPGQSIEVRRLSAGVSITTDMVGPCCVQCDQDDVGLVDADLGPQVRDLSGRVFFGAQEQPQTGAHRQTADDESDYFPRHFHILSHE